VATKLEDLVIRLKADSAELERELRRAEGTVSGTASRMRQSFSSVTGSLGSLRSAAMTLAPVIGGLLGAAGLGKLAKDAIDFGGEIQDAADRIGVGVEALQELRFAARDVGVEQGNLDSSLAKLSVNIGKAASGVKKQVELFDALGISVKDAEGKIRPTDAVLGDIAGALLRIEDPAQRVRVAVELFGRSGAALVPLLAKGEAGIAAMRVEASKTGAVMSEEMVARADELGDELTKLSQVTKVQFSEALIALGPILVSTATLIAQLARATANLFAQFQRASDLTAQQLDARIIKLSEKLAQTKQFAPGDSGTLQDLEGQLREAMMTRDTRMRFGNVVGGTSNSMQADGPAIDLSGLGAPDPKKTGGRAGRAKKEVDPLKDAIAQLKRDYGDVLQAQERLSDERIRLEDTVTKNFQQATLTRVELIRVEAEEQTRLVDRLFADREKAAELTLKINETAEAKIREEMEKTADAGKELFEEFTEFAGDVVGNFVMQTDQDFASLARSIAASLAGDAMKGVLRSLFASSDAKDGEGGGFGGMLGGLLGSIGKIFGFAEGGHFTRPTLALVGDGQDSEWALPDSKLRGLLAASGGRTVVNVNNYGSDQVTTKTRRSGGTEIIDVTVARSIRRQLGAGAMKDEFGRRHAPGVS
jgi:hypothetical protein